MKRLLTRHFWLNVIPATCILPMLYCFINGEHLDGAQWFTIFIIALFMD